MNQPGATKRMISLRGVSKVYVDTYTGARIVAIEDVTFDVLEGEFICIVGPSGCGKTTLLNMVAGLIPPSRGDIVVDGVQVRKPGRDRGMVFQNFALLPWKNVLENVAFGLRIRGVPKQRREEIARFYIRLVGLEGFEEKFPHELSGGMQQRVGVARALANGPKVLLMDEPFGSVDAQTRRTLQDELMRIWEAERITVLFVTHDVDEAAFLADRVVVLTPRPGRVREIVSIGLPRPRRWIELQRSTKFMEIRNHIVSMFVEEK